MVIMKTMGFPPRLFHIHITFHQSLVKYLDISGGVSMVLGVGEVGCGTTDFSIR
jgi:hypothetical protein